MNDFIHAGVKYPTVPAAALGSDPAVGTVVHPTVLPRRIPGAALAAVWDASNLRPIETDPAAVSRSLERFRNHLRSVHTRY